MRMKLLYILLLVFCILPLKAQEYVLMGNVTDARTLQPIPDVILSGKFNDKIYSAITDTLGQYRIRMPKEARMLLKVSHVSYRSQSRLVICKKTTTENFSLMPNSMALDEVVVTTIAQRVKQRNDTTVYFANAYKVNNDATAYDLITQKLPGIGIRDGKLEAHGETVKEILIDGKEYFKSDITLSLKNLPANIINEIQLFDQRSDYSRLTGFDDGTRRKTINIVTQKELSNSLFGKAYTGYGLDDYYKLYGMLNWFQGDMQLSVFAQDNNTSEQNFSMIDLLSTSGTAMNTAPQQSPYSKGTSDNTFHPATSNDVSDFMVGGYSSGETTSRAIGSNFSDVWGKKKKVAFSGHYLFNNAVNETNYDIHDEYFNEGANANLQEQRVHTDNTNHRFNTKVDWDLSRNGHLMLRPSLLYQRKKESSLLHISEEEHATLNIKDLMSQEQYTNQEAINTSNELMYIHRFPSIGSSLSTNIKYSYEDTEENLDLWLNNVQTNTKTKQQTWSDNKSSSMAAVASYIHPLGRYIRLKADAGYSVTYREIKRATNRMDSQTNIMSVDSVLSGKTSSDYGGFISGLSFLYNRRHTQIVGGAEYHAYRMYSVNDITSNSVENNAILPFIHVRYQWGERNCQLHFQYKTEQAFPSMQQLQDAINNTNPTLSIRGNINLKPSYTHSATFRLFIPGKNNGGIFVFFVNAETIHDYIANKRSIVGGALGAAESKSQMLSYINANGYYSTSSLVAYGFPFKLIKSNVNISTLLRYSHIPGYWETKKSYNKQINWNSSLTIGSNISRQVDFVLDCNLQYLNDKNEAHPLLEVNYWTLSFGGQLNWQFCSPFKVVAECGRTGYYGLGTKEMNAIICNMALAYKFMKNKQGELRLSCDDILNQNNCFTQQTNELFRRKSTANVIGRHAMLTFTYNFNTYKGHQ